MTKITIYRFEKGDSGEFHPHGSVEAKLEKREVLVEQGASSVLNYETIDTVTLGGLVCRVEREGGRRVVYLPAMKREAAKGQVE